MSASCVARLKIFTRHKISRLERFAYSTTTSKYWSSAKTPAIDTELNWIETTCINFHWLATNRNQALRTRFRWHFASVLPAAVARTETVAVDTCTTFSSKNAMVNHRDSNNIPSHLHRGCPVIAEKIIMKLTMVSCYSILNLPLVQTFQKDVPLTSSHCRSREQHKNTASLSHHWTQKARLLPTCKRGRRIESTESGPSLLKHGIISPLLSRNLTSLNKDLPVSIIRKILTNSSPLPLG